MKITPSGIAVTIALVVIAVFFGVPGLSPWGAQSSASLTNDSQAAPSLTSTTMPTQPMTELIIRDDVVGTGDAAVSGGSVTVNYVGALTNGTIFDASANHPETVNGFTFNLGAGQVIKGWDQGIVGMKVGGKRTLFIPASLAYGSQEIGKVIPANSDLVFQVELLSVQ